jgi:hypothetical protein
MHHSKAVSVQGDESIDQWGCVSGLVCAINNVAFFIDTLSIFITSAFLFECVFVCVRVCVCLSVRDRKAQMGLAYFINSLVCFTVYISACVRGSTSVLVR